MPRIPVALVLLAAAAPALAQDAKTSPLPAHLPLRTEACFGRVYDAAHLAAHPKQKVASLHIAREFGQDPFAEQAPWTEEALKAVDGEDGRVLVTAYVRLRERKGVYSNALSCAKTGTGTVLCAIDCDGGTFALRPSGSSLLLENGGFVVVGGCGASEDDSDNPVHVAPGADDKLFRLDAKAFSACMAEREAMAPAWAKRGRPLRVRFKEAETLCLARRYDAAHLAAHPRQAVKRIAVLKSKDSAPEGDDTSYRLTFRVETRDGRSHERTADCAPDRYAYACQPAGIPLDADRYLYLTRGDGGDALLRDRHGLLSKMFRTTLGDDDRVFRLHPGTAQDCAF